MKSTGIGEFEELVLLIVCVLAGRAYGVSIQEEILNQIGREVSIGAVHSALYRMEQKGYLNSRLGEVTRERGNRPRRYFRPTAAGRQALVDMRLLRDKLWSLVPSLKMDAFMP